MQIQSSSLLVRVVARLVPLTFVLCACGGGTTVGTAPAPLGGATPGAAASGTPSAAPAATPTAPGTTAAPTAAPTVAPSATPPGSPLPSATPASAASPGRLASYDVDPAKLFVAGISSGGFFAVQMQVAHAAVFKGAAIYAGGVYWCAQGSVALALADCGGETVNGQALYESTLSLSETYLDQQSASGTIDPESNLIGKPVYLWSGTQDQVVNPKEMADLDSEFVHYGSNVTFDSTFPANHGWESPDGELACGVAASPYMIDCDRNGRPYDSEQTWLSMFFGALNPRNGGALQGSLLHVDQTEFGAGASNSMDTNGYVYVPKNCAQGARCGFVLTLHGCLQVQSVIGTKFESESGLDEWADTNSIIVLYPEALESSAPNPTNPNGCWDWWGYSNQEDPNYALKSGVQLGIVYKMVQRVTGAP